MTREEKVTLKAEVEEILNQLAIKLNEIDKEYETDWDYETGKSFPNPDFCPENDFLLIVRNFCVDMTKYGGSEYAIEYYSSSQF